MSRIQTVQQTSKIWKAIQVLGVLGMVGGLTAFYMTHEPGCAFTAGACVPIWIIGRVGAWWYHG